LEFKRQEILLPPLAVILSLLPMKFNQIESALFNPSIYDFTISLEDWEGLFINPI